MDFRAIKFSGGGKYAEFWSVLGPPTSDCISLCWLASQSNLSLLDFIICILKRGELCSLNNRIVMRIIPTRWRESPLNTLLCKCSHINIVRGDPFLCLSKDAIYEQAYSLLCSFVVQCYYECFFEWSVHSTYYTERSLSLSILESYVKGLLFLVMDSWNEWFLDLPAETLLS